MYLAAIYWRGSINVASMRQCKTEQEAIDYLKKEHAHDFQTGFFRIYELFTDRKPRLVRLK
jgi:hypothetical protein